MEAFGVTDHAAIDMLNYGDGELAGNELENYLEITNRGINLFYHIIKNLILFKYEK